jgi:hypothetical protein
MDQVSYYKARAQHYSGLAGNAGDTKLREAYEAVALDFSVRSITADANKRVHLIDGLAENF